MHMCILNANISEHLKLFFQKITPHIEKFYSTILIFSCRITLFPFVKPILRVYTLYLISNNTLIYNMLYNIVVSNKGTLRNFSLLEINDLCQLVETICLYQNSFRRNILISFQLLKHQFISTTYYNIFTRSIKLQF